MPHILYVCADRYSEGVQANWSLEQEFQKMPYSVQLLPGSTEMLGWQTLW